MKRTSWLAAAALSMGTYATCFAQINGKVTLQGDPPEMRQIKEMAANPQCAQLHKDPVYEDTVVAGDKGELANVIVFIKEATPGDLKGATPAKPARLDQKGCMYTPHVLAVQIGQPVVIASDDPFLHNVHCLAVKNKAFNFIQVNVGETKVEPFTAEETFQIKCDVHPWMHSVVRVFDHPYFAVTNDAGKFVIDTRGLKDGTYTVQAWHEVYKDSKPQQVEVKGGKATGEVAFSYNAADAKPDAKPVASH